MLSTFSLGSESVSIYIGTMEKAEHTFHAILHVVNFVFKQKLMSIVK